MSFNPDNHPRASDGKWESTDAGRSDAGQVSLRESPWSDDDVREAARAMDPALWRSTHRQSVTARERSLEMAREVLDAPRTERAAIVDPSAFRPGYRVTPTVSVMRLQAERAAVRALRAAKASALLSRQPPVDKPVDNYVTPHDLEEGSITSSEERTDSRHCISIEARATTEAQDIEVQASVSVEQSADGAWLSSVEAHQLAHGQFGRNALRRDFPKRPLSGWEHGSMADAWSEVEAHRRTFLSFEFHRQAGHFDQPIDR